MFGSIPTSGGAVITVFGARLGLDSRVLSGVLTGGLSAVANTPRSLGPLQCTVVVRGIKVQCLSPVGVGGNYSVSVSVDGGWSSPSTDKLYYTNPTVNSVEGPGVLAPTRGALSVTLRGSNFGTVGGYVASAGMTTTGSNVVQAWARPTSGVPLVFNATNCTVVEDHVAMNCTVSGGIGGSLSWSVSVEGLGSTVPVSGYEPPVVTSVTLSEPTANTAGGTWITVNGDNFGSFIDYVTVSISMGGGGTKSRTLFGGIQAPDPGSLVVVCGNCSLAEPHTSVRCAVPAGAGAITMVRVDVLGQSTFSETISHNLCVVFRCDSVSVMTDVVLCAHSDFT